MLWNSKSSLCTNYRHSTCHRRQLPSWVARNNRIAKRGGGSQLYIYSSPMEIGRCWLWRHYRINVMIRQEAIFQTIIIPYLPVFRKKPTSGDLHSNNKWMFHSSVIIHAELTDVAIFSEAAGEEGHRGEQSQALFDHTTQIFELPQVLRVNRSVRCTLAFQYSKESGQCFLLLTFTNDICSVLPYNLSHWRIIVSYSCKW